jgi:hypothetical protein
VYSPVSSSGQVSSGPGAWGKRGGGSGGGVEEVSKQCFSGRIFPHRQGSPAERQQYARLGACFMLPDPRLTPTPTLTLTLPLLHLLSVNRNPVFYYLTCTLPTYLTYLPTYLTFLPYLPRPFVLPRIRPILAAASPPTLASPSPPLLSS